MVELAIDLSFSGPSELSDHFVSEAPELGLFLLFHVLFFNW